MPSPPLAPTSTITTTTHIPLSSSAATTTTHLIKSEQSPMSSPTPPKSTNPTPSLPTTSPSPSPPPLRPTHHPPKLLSRPRKLRKLSPSSSSSATPKRPTPTSTRPLSTPGEIDTALSHLRHADPLLSTVIDHHQPPSFDAFQTPFLALTKSILYQQLAYKAGTSIYSRFVALCGGESSVVPSTVLHLTPPQLRQIGVSSRKSSYLHDLARKYQNGILSDKGILSLDDKSLFTMLTMVNGIGSWSVHMFMIFSLHRPDVLPVNDLQVRKGVQLLYGLDDLPRPSQMDQLCDKWRPFRSVGAWYMWRLVEAKTSSSGFALPPVNSRVISLPHPVPDPQTMPALPAPQQRQQHHPQFIDPINGIMNIGSNYAQLN
ncbi:hypothetical protein RND81_06G091500 [Saponaria officinalis]|uniref:HhH-GPD domain-containing protein n=1 Tax=Saponaria officinalis TaxID=3572 RepID=A0AAW1K4V6_SAPOF